MSFTHKDKPLYQILTASLSTKLLLTSIHTVLVCRCGSEDKSDHAQLAHRLLQRTQYAVAVPNYRLSPAAPDAGPVVHPEHASDMLTALEFLVRTPPKALDFTRIFLIGHSCSAHMLASTFLSSPFEELTPSQELLRAVQAIALSEGIYNLDLLCESFPTYRSWFVEAAFGPPSDTDGYGRFSVAEYPIREGFSHAQWLLVHSRGDTLIDQKQADTFFSHLQASFSAEGMGDLVRKNVTSISMEHNDMLKTDAYSDFMGNYFRSFL